MRPAPPGAARVEAPAAGLLLPLLGTILVVLLVALPILAHPYLPLVDLPNHVARLHIAVTEGGPLAQYYSYKVGLVPNSAADLAFILFGDPSDPLRFAQLSFAFYAAALVISAMVLSRVVWGRWSIWPLAAGLVVYNGNFFWGFQNFLLTMPLAIAGLALWIGTEGRPPWQRLLLLVPLGSLVYLLHFFAFAFLAVAAFGREVQRLVEARGRRWQQLGEGALLALPFLPPSLWLLSDILFSPPSPVGNYSRFGGWLDLLVALRSVTVGPTVNTLPLPNVLGDVALVAVLALLAPLLLRRGPRLVLAPPMLGPVLALAAGVLLAPSFLNGVALVNIRFPFAFCVVLFAASRWEGLPRRAAVALTVAVLALIGLRGLQFERGAAVHSAQMADLSETLTRLPSGARLLPLFEGDWPEERFLHTQDYAVVQRDAFVPTLFQGVHAITVLPEWRTYSHPLLGIMSLDIALRPEPTTVYFEGFPPVEVLIDWRRKFTHVILLGKAEGPGPEIPGLQPLANAGRFTLYEVLPEQT